MSDPLTPVDQTAPETVPPVIETPPVAALATPPMDREAVLRARRNRNLMLGLSLLAFIVIVYLVTVLRMGGYVAQRPL